MLSAPLEWVMGATGLDGLDVLAVCVYALVAQLLARLLGAAGSSRR